jgi:8-oxo-dGTP pyrophosphatase MutT (NUDIX family)
VPIPAFIATLRAKIGHDPLWLTGVSGIVLDASDRLLLTRRVDSGAWALPSGIIEPGEQPAVTLRREVTEETGVVAEVERLVSVVSLQPQVYTNGDQVQFLDLTFACGYLGGVARVADDENLEVAWFPLSALPDLDSYTRTRVELARSKQPLTYFDR